MNNPQNPPKVEAQAPEAVYTFAEMSEIEAAAFERGRKAGVNVARLAAPPQAPAKYSPKVGLTDAEIDAIASTVWEHDDDDMRRREFARAILATPTPAPEGQPEAVSREELYGVRRYLNDVLESGTAHERAVAQTALRMLAAPQASGKK